MSSGASPAVEVTNLRKEFRHRKTTRLALESLSFRVDAGETLGVVGESGAGKSTLVRILAGLDRASSGSVLVNGQPPRLAGGRPSSVQMVFQNPFDALNPLLAIGESVGEPLRSLPRRVRSGRVSQALEAVGLDATRAKERPGSFSGGQLQRIVIARALAAEPTVLLCDEGTSALDVSVQAQIVNLLLDLQDERNFACVLVTHDLAVARVLADHILVLRRGVMVEQAPAEQFFREPHADYSSDLLAAFRRMALPARYATR